MTPQRKILDIHCSTCGAPASFDIARQIYHCAYCGADTGIKASLAEKKGFQSLHRINLQKKAANFPGFSACVLSSHGECDCCDQWTDRQACSQGISHHTGHS